MRTEREINAEIDRRNAAVRRARRGDIARSAKLAKRGSKTTSYAGYWVWFAPRLAGGVWCASKYPTKLFAATRDEVIVKINAAIKGN